MIVVTFLLMFAGAGLTSGLIREAVEDRVSDDTVFWANLCVATTLAILVYLFASPLAELLGAPEANWLLQSLRRCSFSIWGLMWQVRNSPAAWPSTRRRSAR